MAWKSISKDMRKETVVPASCGSNEGLTKNQEIEDDPEETSTTRNHPKRKATVAAK